MQNKHGNKLMGFDPREMFNKSPGLQPGTADLFVGGETLEVLGRMTACYFSSHDIDNKRYFRNIVVIAPPMVVWNVADETIYGALVKGVEDIYGTTLEAEQVSAYTRFVKIVRCNHLNTTEIENHVAAAGERQLILVPKAEKYRDDTLEQSWDLGRAGALFPEDVWAPHIAQMATASIAATKLHGSLIVFSVTGESLVRDTNLRLLCDVEDLYPVVLGYDGEPNTDELFAKAVPRWAALATAGRASQAFEELEQSGFDDKIKKQIALQLAVRAGDTSRALVYLRYYAADTSKLPAEMLARFGKMAYTCGETELATDFFEKSMDTLSDQMWLETGLVTLTSLNASALVEKCWARLELLFPHSKVLVENREYRLLQISSMGMTGQTTSHSRAGFEDVHTYIVDAFDKNENLDYAALLSEVKQRWPHQLHLFTLSAAIHAYSQQNLPTSLQFSLIATENTQYEPQAVGLLVRTLQRMLLLEVHPKGEMEVYKLPLIFVLDYLARHPGEARLRAELSAALSVETAGLIGLPILASTALNLISDGTVLQESIIHETSHISNEEFTDFFERALKWMSEQNVVEPGVTKLPSSLVGNNADGLIAYANKAMQFAARNIENPDELDVFEKMAYVVCLTQPYAKSVSADLDALRLFGAKLCLHGQPQRARDIAEQILCMAGESAVRKRIAWGAYADIYHRTHNQVDSLIGLTCAAMSKSEIEPSDLFQEAYTLLRVARDLHLYDVARTVLPSCRKLYEIDGLGELGKQRLDGIELGLDVMQSNDLDEQALRELLERTRVHCETVMLSSDELLPAASQFLQVAGRMERDGHELDLDVVALRSSLAQRLGTDTATFVNAISAAYPSADEVVWLHNRLGAASNSEDTALDQLSVVMAAHRLLLPRTPDISAVDAALAVELLSDRSLEIDSTSNVLNAAWPAKFIAQLSQTGIAIMMLATDSEGEVAIVIAENGELTLTRPERRERNFVSRLNAWAVKYPYRYGFIEREEGNIEFYTSMTEFVLPMPKTKDVLIVAEPTLQQLTYNLLLTDNQFAGESRAIGLVPSLTWFENIRKRKAKSTDERIAWISCVPDSEAYGTLEMLFARLGPAFNQYQFKTDMSGNIPKDVRNASFAVVTAHGGLTSDERYIHSIADEQSLKESPVTLARALAGVEVVILFVCSGGRVDRHPLSNTTVSLPKMLLDRGCRVVLASPWPLAAVVPGHWFEKFMEAWESGDSVMQANFKANQYVAERLGPEAGLSLAMMAYGDVTLTKNR